MDNYKDAIFEPLEYYVNYGKDTHKKNVSEYFDELTAKSGVDVEENRTTVKRYRDKLAKIEALKKELRKNKTLRVVSIVLSVITVVLLAAFLPEVALKIAVCLPIGVIAVFVIVSVFKKTGKKIKELDEKVAKESDEANVILCEARAQMAPLNALFSDNDTFDLIEKTMPQISFDKQFKRENLEDLKNNYDFNGTIAENSSVLDVVSGTIYKNPFVFERIRTCEIVPYTYTGTLLITWTTYSFDSKGRRVAHHHSQTLVAHVTKPKPQYTVSTQLSYGCQAAPDLSFTRENKHYERLSENEVEREVRSGAKKLKKKSNKALKTGKSFTEMANTKFDVLFDATDRDNEQQFRLMFTPLAQREMLDLVRSAEGYGDDFDFFKRKKLNIIRSEHSQSRDMDTSAKRYYSFDFDEIKSLFNNFNNDYFKSVYFDFAPLIAIPAYQEEPTATFEAPSYSDIGYTQYNYEMIANKMDARVFAHERTATESILKTVLVERTDTSDTVEVTAHSYAGEPRTDFVPMLGGDGKMHLVPVYWTEYIPLSRSTNITVKNIGLTTTQYSQKTASYDAHELPENAVCFRGIFAHTDALEKANKLINNILGKGE
ncbi:MAG: hypothetical protein E7626_00830 [Ruminococcaceae bacterium]|nr:hypothetical protein [Oscillospiraceae bacterium]